MNRQNKTIQFYWLSVTLFLMITFVICRYFGFNGLFGQDSHEYLRYTKELGAYLSGGPEPGKFNWPIVYPLAASFTLLIAPALLSLQIISLISAAICYFYFGKSLNILYPEGTQRQRYAFIWLLCSPFFLRAAVIGMPDMFCCALLSATYYHILKAEKEHKESSLIIAVILAVVVLQTRYALGFLLLPIVPVVFSAIRKRYSLILFFLAGAILALTPSIFLRNDLDTGLLHNPWITNLSPMNIIRSDFVNENGTYHYTFPNIIYALSIFVHPGFCFATPFLLVFAFSKPLKISWWWFAALGLYLIALSSVPAQNLRFLLPAFPLALLLLFPGFEDAFRFIKNRTAKIAMLLTIVIVQASVSYLAIRPFYHFQQEEYIIASELRQYPPVTIYTFAIDDALRTYGVPQDVISLWNPFNPMIESGNLLLYNPLRFNDRFRNTPPDKIYNKLLQQNRLIYLKAFPNGWQLYKIR